MKLDFHQLESQYKENQSEAERILTDSYKSQRKAEKTAHIREHEKMNDLSKTPIIALTANASEDDRLICENAGISDVVTKPYTQIDLLIA